MAHPVSNIVRFPPARKMKIFILKLFEWEDNWPLPPGGQQEDSRGQSCSAIPWSTNKSLLKTNDLEKTLRSWPLNSVDITHIQPPATDGGREWGDGSGERVGVYKYKYADYSPHLHFSSPAPFLHCCASSDCWLYWVQCRQVSKCQSTNKTISSIRMWDQ